MTPRTLINLADSASRDLPAFLPELVLCGAIVLMLVLRLFSRFDRRHMGGVALVLTLYALYVSWVQWNNGIYDPRPEPTAANRSIDDTVRKEGAISGPRVGSSASLELFSGLLVYDNVTIFLRMFLLGFAVLVIWLCLMTGIPDREDSADFFCLLLGATLGMSLMASANHLMMIFIGVEMASLPSYALAGFLKGRRQSSEAALKYVVYGGGAAGIMLYGISLLAGKFGTGYFPDLASFMAANPLDPIVLLGTLFVLIGVGFKLAAVPFHFWCPDVFEGASAEVAGFLSVASKGAALALLARIVLGLGGLADAQFDPQVWERVTPYLVPVLAVFSVITVTFGNLAAYTQTNLKRLLAYSTIAHAGFMMMGLATMTRDGAAAVLFYLMIYLFMNLGAFAVVAFLRNVTGSEDMRDFAGLIRRSPVMVIALTVFLLSLLGLPPLAGFAAKFQIFGALFDAARLYSSPAIDQPGLGNTMYALLFIGGLNTVLSLFYYLKPLKIMILDQSVEEVEGKPAEPLPIPWLADVYAALLAIVILIVGIFWDPLATASGQGVSRFHTAPGELGGVPVARGGQP